MAQSDRSKLIWSNDIIITCYSWLVLSCIGSQWARCSTFKCLTSACSCSSQRASETLLLPQLHLYRSAMGWFMYAIWGLFHVCYICSTSSISYMLTAECLWMHWQQQVSVHALSQKQIYSGKTKYIKIVMYITMPIPPRVSWQIYIYIRGISREAVSP